MARGEAEEVATWQSEAQDGEHARCDHHGGDPAEGAVGVGLPAAQADGAAKSDNLRRGET